MPSPDSAIIIFQLASFVVVGVATEGCSIVMQRRSD